MASQPLFIAIRFDRPEYHGLRDNGSVDWPPAPVRIAGALTSAAHSLDNPAKQSALSAIDAIMTSPPPKVHVSRATPLGLPVTYTQKSGLDNPGKSTSKSISDFLDLSLLAMNTQSRTAKPVDGVSLDLPLLIFELEVDILPGQLAALQEAAVHIGYFGRSVDPAEVTIWPDSVPATALELELLEQWQALPSTTGNTRGWTRLTREWMDENYRRLFEASGDSHIALPSVPPQNYIQPLRYVRMAATDQTTIVPLERSVPNHVIPLLFDRLNQTGVLDGFSEVTVFPAVFAHHAYADGRCLGLGLTGPSALAVDTAAAEIAPLIWEGALLELQRGPVTQDGAATLRPTTWSRANQVWKSATPYRGFPDATVVEYEVNSEIQERWGLTPTRIVASTEPTQRWEHRWKQSIFADGLVDWWIELEMPEKVSGPMLLSRHQKLGTGLLVGSSLHLAEDQHER